MAKHSDDSFRYMESLFRAWLEMARQREILRLLELVEKEFHRRGYRLTYEVNRGPRAGHSEL